jgi:hypothetical protein
MCVIKPICFEPTHFKRELDFDCSLEASETEEQESNQGSTHLPGAGSKQRQHGICGVILY